jgi:acyl-CoA dehydrogenase
MIDLELPDQLKGTKNMMRAFAENVLRPAGRKYDEEEHTVPTEIINMVHGMMKGRTFDAGSSSEGKKEKKEEKKEKKPKYTNLTMGVTLEEIFWGDAGIALTFPSLSLGAAAVQATGTPEQKKKFLARFSEDEPCWGAMAITEPEAGSDTANIKATAVHEDDHWVLNGEKIFVTQGKSAIVDSDGFTVVWATVDRQAGRAGIKAFVVEHGTPGMEVSKVEDKLGIRASDTATISFMDCKIPYENILGNPEVVDKKKTKGFKGAMATFDATRPMVAMMAIGVGRAALDFLKMTLDENGVNVRYGLNPNRLSSVEKDVIEMESTLSAARLLTWRSLWMLDNGMRNNEEAAMAKAKAGLAVTQVTQKAVELMGPLGYSRELLLEKWMRDAKINDIFEGTGQIQMLIVARRVLDFGRDQLK